MLSNAVELTLSKVPYVPNLSKNLLSVPAMTQMGAGGFMKESVSYPRMKEKSPLDIWLTVNSTW